LTAIAGLCDTMLDEKKGNLQAGEMRKMVADISESSKELIDFVSQLHEMSKFEGITPSFTFIEVNLTELMASYRREAMNYTKPDVAVRVSSDLSPHCRAILDTNLMHQLMMHLLSNAAKHVEQGDIFIRYTCERRGLKVSINYTGTMPLGHEDADVHALIQHEDALKDNRKFSQLGLAICKTIVDMFGGEFFMDSDSGMKTVASFWFPCKMKDIYKDI
jgi:K+-sensing histidine kinase KdpD